MINIWESLTMAVDENLFSRNYRKTVSDENADYFMSTVFKSLKYMTSVFEQNIKTTVFEKISPGSLMKVGVTVEQLNIQEH